MSSQQAIPRVEDTDEIQNPTLELLKVVLENLDSTQCLDDHPWAHSRIVQDQCSRQPSLMDRPPGLQLAVTVAELFREMLPPGPPRQGKRLDTRWGEFGLLAARYFSPFLKGLPHPDSLREAWHGIDSAILSFAFDGGTDLAEAEKLRYRLVANEPVVAPDSTLSDWHRKGLQRLASSIERREKHLQDPPSAEATLSQAAVPAETRRLRSLIIGIALWAVAALLVAAVTLGFLKARRVYQLALVLREDAGSLAQLGRSGADLAVLHSTGLALTDLRRDFDLMKAEVQPLLYLGPWLKWVPVYGGDLASSSDLLEIADLLLQGGEQSYKALSPLLDAMRTDQTLRPPQALEILAQAGPELSQAREDFDQAASLRAGVDAARLSPGTRGALEQYIDPLLPKIRDGLAVALALPSLLGATREGPRTYLLLAENEDELRATGGFITAAGNLVVKDGRILSLDFKDTGRLDNWSMPYPNSPWQLEDYMNSTVLVLRDANWFTDFPITAQYAEYLYSYASSHSVDGVIAFDQHSLVMLLQALGPVKIPGQEGSVDASNVLTYMRQAKLPPADRNYPVNREYKAFINDLASAVLHRLYDSGMGDWPVLFQCFIKILEEKHLLLQLDDPALDEVLSKYGWNGAVSAGPGDFLMVVDSNVGFNKTNAVVTTTLFYDVDLTDPALPSGSLTAVHENGGPAMKTCKHWDKVGMQGQEEYPINDCYWDYMRVYVPEGAALLDSEAQDIPGAWLIKGMSVKARVDILDEEEIAGVQALGTMLVVPGGSSIETGMRYSLPPDILSQDPDSGRLHYQLTVKKQPGTTDIPITVRVHLPTGVQLESVPQGAVLQEDNLLFTANLRWDLYLALSFFPE